MDCDICAVGGHENHGGTSGHGIIDKRDDHRLDCRVSAANKIAGLDTPRITGHSGDIYTAQGVIDGVQVSVHPKYHRTAKACSSASRVFRAIRSCRRLVQTGARSAFLATGGARTGPRSAGFGCVVTAETLLHQRLGSRDDSSVVRRRSAGRSNGSRLGHAGLYAQQGADLGDHPAYHRGGDPAAGRIIEGPFVAVGLVQHGEHDIARVLDRETRRRRTRSWRSCYSVRRPAFPPSRFCRRRSSPSASALRPVPLATTKTHQLAHFVRTSPPTITWVPLAGAPRAWRSSVAGRCTPPLTRCRNADAKLQRADGNTVAK